MKKRTYYKMVWELVPGDEIRVAGDQLFPTVDGSDIAAQVVQIEDASYQANMHVRVQVLGEDGYYMLQDVYRYDRMELASLATQEYVWAPPDAVEGYDVVNIDEVLYTVLSRSRLRSGKSIGGAVGHGQNFYRFTLQGKDDESVHRIYDSDIHHYLFTRVPMPLRRERFFHEEGIE